MRYGTLSRCAVLAAGLIGLPLSPACTAAEASNWATDSQLEGIVDLLDPDYQRQPIKVDRLPLEYAVKSVHGKGGRVVYSFEDPNCGYCRQLARTFENIGNLTVYTFVVTFLGPDSVEKANAVWCSRNRARAWHAVMQEKALPAAVADCQAPNAKIMKLVGLLGINMTPTVFFADGSRMNGVKPRAEIEARLRAAGR